jgi:hypothetical protein
MAVSYATPPDPARKSGAVIPSTRPSAAAAEPGATVVLEKSDDASWASVFVEEFRDALRRPSAVDATGGWRWLAWVAAAYLAGASLIRACST